MKVEVKKVKDTYRIISRSTKKHPALIHIAELLKEANKTSKLKIGIFSVTGGEFETTKNVYSYIGDKTEKMSKKKFYRWVRGVSVLKQKRVKWDQVLEMSGKEIRELEEIFR